MQITNNFMSKILVKQTTERNKKRATNFLGKFQKILYGTLVYDDELYYEEQLKNLRTNQETLKVNVEKQFTLVRSTWCGRKKQSPYTPRAIEQRKYFH
jgi:hypothetical protein